MRIHKSTATTAQNTPRAEFKKCSARRAGTEEQQAPSTVILDLCGFMQVLYPCSGKGKRLSSAMAEMLIGPYL